jgi:hypothetical protein
MRMPSVVLRVLLILLGLPVLAAAGCSSSAAAAPPAWRRPVLVELYTSQGCSSCPPADAFVRDLPKLGFGREKVIPLTFHVDYWNRLGWPDPFSNEAFTERQQWYASSNRLRSPDGAAGLDGLYTPQMIVDGAVQFSGQRRETAAREMERAASRPPSFDLAVEASVRGSAVDLIVRTTNLAPAQRERDWRITAVLAARRAETDVRRGENAGEKLEEAAVVRALSDRIALPPVGTPARLRLAKPADLTWPDAVVVVVVQSEATREIGAVRALDPRDLGSR